MTGQCSIFKADRSQQFHELYAFFYRKQQFLLIRWHISLCPAIDQGHLFHSIYANRCTCRIHGCIPTSNDYDLTANIHIAFSTLEILQKCNRTDCRT